MTTILIADDEPNIVMLASVMFTDMGMTVVSAQNGEEAIQKAIESRPDLIITDIIMPLKDGFEVCKAIRNHTDISDTPIIILSALGDEYNKITGFEGGADDYITKPFNIDELKARTKALLLRYDARKKSMPPEPIPNPKPDPIVPPISSKTDFSLLETGIPKLDESLFGGLPEGSNILITGPIGTGKSSFARQFITKGIRQSERTLVIAVDDSPTQIRHGLTTQLDKAIDHYESMDLVRFVDAYSWSSLNGQSTERFAVNGMLDLTSLASIISDASYEIGQTVQAKLGGRRVIDSISSLFVEFDLSTAQRFLNQIARTALAFGGVTTLFVLEQIRIIHLYVDIIT